MKFYTFLLMLITFGPWIRLVKGASHRLAERDVNILLFLHYVTVVVQNDLCKLTGMLIRKAFVYCLLPNCPNCCSRPLWLLICMKCFLLSYVTMAKNLLFMLNIFPNHYFTLNKILKIKINSKIISFFFLFFFQIKNCIS